MLDPLNQFILVSIGLFCAVWLYARWLSGIHDRYTPDRVHWTVVGGETLIHIALFAVCRIGFLPLAAFFFSLFLHSVGAIPIVLWQAGQARKRKAEREAAKHRK